MGRKLQTKQRTKNKLRTRLLIVGGTLTVMFTITASLLVYLNISKVERTRASGTGDGGGGNYLNNGDIISEFTWERNPVTIATLGQDAIRVSEEANSVFGGRASTGGLSAGKTGKDINLEIASNEMFNQDGIDISIDFRRNETDGNFFSRSSFNFGIEKGFLCISYRLENKQGKSENVKTVTTYEVPVDPVFRTYRFIYTPSTGKAEIFVNSVIVWTRKHENNTPLSWKNAGNIFIGKGMNGGGADMAILDNLVIRTAGSIAPLAESLLNFMLETENNGVKIHWSTSANSKVQYFTIERSVNGIDFVNIARIPADSTMSFEEEYVYSDKSRPASAVAYYRLRQTFQNGKFITHGLSAIRFKSESVLSIERISPTPFKNSFDVSYFIPGSGRVWIQLTNSKGKIFRTETFDAPQGKNVHVYRDDAQLEPGDYMLSIIFDNKKVSAKVSKSAS
jgi:hypothetical protein